MLAGGVDAGALLGLLARFIASLGHRMTCCLFGSCVAVSFVTGVGSTVPAVPTFGLGDDPAFAPRFPLTSAMPSPLSEHGKN